VAIAIVEMKDIFKRHNCIFYVEISYEKGTGRANGRCLFTVVSQRRPLLHRQLGDVLVPRRQAMGRQIGAVRRAEQNAGLAAVDG
jgi:hypothetical protein